MDSPMPENSAREFRRQEIQAVVAKAADLRALHATLLQGNSPCNLKVQTCCPSPCGPRSSKLLSSQDYPVFTPSYEEVMPGYHQKPSEIGSPLVNDNRTQGKHQDEDEGSEVHEEIQLDSKRNTRRLSGFVSREQLICSDDDHGFYGNSSLNYGSSVRRSPGSEYVRSCRGTDSGELNAIMSCDQFKPANMDKDTRMNSFYNKHRNSVVPATDPTFSLHTPPKNKTTPIFSWLFPRFKKKVKAEATRVHRPESIDASDVLKEWQTLSLESLKKEVFQANESRHAALMEVSEMKSSVMELREKLVHLETYCKDLKRALKRATQGNDSLAPEKSNGTRKGKSNGDRDESIMPVSHEVLEEGFLQIVSETRISMKQFCRALVSQIEETDYDLVDKLHLLLKPHNLGLNLKPTKAILFQMEALLNQSLYENFENNAFRKSGCAAFLDPREDRKVKFEAFVALRNLSWSEVTGKGTKYYSEDFSRFCDQKMSCIISMLNWSRPWPEQLLQSFFIAAKCVWLLHLLAFSFDPQVSILRVGENSSFDPFYMDDIMLGKQQIQIPSRVRIMLTPGFYVHDKVLRCKVLCVHRTAN